MKLFLYGTLMKGHSNHHLVTEVGGRFIGKAYIRDKNIYFVYPNSFPAVVDGKNVVFGEVWEIPDSKIETSRGLILPIKLFDALEGYDSRREKGNMYNRRRIKAVLCNGRKVWCSYYHWNGVIDETLFIKNGDWGKTFKKYSFF